MKHQGHELFETIKIINDVARSLMLFQLCQYGEGYGAGVSGKQLREDLIANLNNDFLDGAQIAYSLRPNLLYDSLTFLVESKLIKKEHSSDDGAAKFLVTPAGRKLAKVEMARLEGVCRRILAVLQDGDKGKEP